MAADPSAVHAMEKYGNWTTCTGPLGQSGMVQIHGMWYDSWYIYYRDTMSEEDFKNWVEGKRNLKMTLNGMNIFLE